MVRIYADVDLVGVGACVATPHLRGDRIGGVIVHARGDVEGRVVVCHPHFGTFGRLGSLERIALRKMRYPGLLPYRLVKPAVDEDRRGGMDRMNDGTGQSRVPVRRGGGTDAR